MAERANRPTEAEVRGLMRKVRLCNLCALERFGQASRDDDGLWRDECYGCGELQFLGTYTERQEPPHA